MGQVWPAWPRAKPLAEFSCHWAAVAALVRLKHPGFTSIGGDKPEDLAREVELRAAVQRNEQGDLFCPGK